MPCENVVALVCTAPLCAPVYAQQPKPNVVFILADNVGYGDLGSSVNRGLKFA